MNKLANRILGIALASFVVGLLSRGALQGAEQREAAQAAAVAQEAEAAIAACDFLPTGTPPLSFVYGGKSSDSLLPTWQKEESLEQLPGKDVRVISWTDPHTGLKVTATVTAYRDFAAAEWVLRFENLGKADTPILEDVQALDLTIGTTKAMEPVILRQIVGSDHTERDFVPFERTLTVGPTNAVALAPVGGRSSNGICPFFNLQFASGGIIVAVGWSGQWSARVDRAVQGPTRVRAGMELTHLLLHPGEAIRSPSILLLRWRGGDWVDAQNQFRRLLLAHYLPRLNGKPVQCAIAAQSVMHEGAGAFGADAHGEWVSEAGQIKSAKINKELGCDTLWLDGAWFVGGFPNGVGNWEPRPKEFPRGLKPIADECHRLGLKWLLWWEPERVARGTRIAREHPDFVLDGPNTPLINSFLFNLADPKARQWMTDLLNRQIDEFGVDCLRNDTNINPLSYWRANDKPDRQGITEIRYIEGLYQMWDDIRTKHPEMWLDNCASGGRRIDIELLKRAAVQTRSDSCCAPGRADWDQSQTYGLSLYVPCHATIGWETDTYSVRSSATSGYVGEWDILDPNFPLEAAKAAITEVRENQKYWYGDYYPLSSWGMAPKAWMAYQFHRPDLDEGMVLMFRQEDCPHSQFQTKLRGLDPEQRYLVRFSDEQRTETHKTMLGKELAGMTLRIDQPRSSLLVRYEPARAP